MANIHVLFLPSWYPTDWNPLSGSFFREQAEALAGAGLKVGVVYTDLRSLRQLAPGSLLQSHFQVKSSEENGIPVYRRLAWNIPVKALKRGYHIHLTRKVFDRYVKEQGLPDVVHVQSSLWAGVSAIRIKKAYGVPFVVTEHSSAFIRGLLSGYELNVAREIFTEADARMAVSAYLARRLENDLNLSEFEIVPNMVDVDFFSCQSVRRQSRPFKFLSVAHLTENKGMDVLIRAFSMAFRGSPEVLLYIGGDGPERANLERLAAELNIPQQVHFMGRLSRTEVRDAMCASNAFVLPSYHETFGVVLIEAMSTGMPVIATRSGGPEEIIEEGTGIIVSPGDVEGIKVAMVQLYNSYDIYDSKRISTSIFQRYGRKVIANTLNNIYDRIIGEI